MKITFLCLCAMLLTGCASSALQAIGDRPVSAACAVDRSACYALIGTVQGGIYLGFDKSTSDQLIKLTTPEPTMVIVPMQMPGIKGL